MATLGHVAVGVAAARWRSSPPAAPRLALSMVGLAALSVLPDVDVITFRLGIPYSNPYGHRGMTHSLLFAAAVGLLVAIGLACRRRPVLGLRRRSVIADALLATVVAASHGVLDAMTTGGLGIEFLWPVDTHRYFLPWQFIPVAPIGGRMLSARGFSVLLTEAVLFLPAWAYAFWPRAQGGRSSSTSRRAP